MRFRLSSALHRVCLCCVCLGACAGSQQPSPDIGTHGSTSAVQALTVTELARFDRLVTPASIFPDPSQRALYEFMAPSSDHGRRSYTFQLKPQRGMVADRHFHVLTISWAHAGTFVSKAGSGSTQSSTGGPHGGFIDFAMRTTDGAYDVRISEAMLLPDVVQVPDLDLTRLAATLVQQYDKSASER
jgi:hypothetical protein